MFLIILIKFWIELKSIIFLFHWMYQMKSDHIKQIT